METTKRKGQGEILDYEERRLSNLKDNADFLATLGISKLKSEFKGISTAPKSIPRGIKPNKRENVLLPRRQSARLKRIDPDGVPLPPVEPQPEPVIDNYNKPRKPKGTLVATDYIHNKEESDACEKCFTELKTIFGSNSSNKERSTPYSRVLQSIKNFKLDDHSVVKVVLARVTSLLFHPNAERPIIFAGDKWGHVGLWDTKTDSGNTNGVHCFEPHSGNVTSLVIHQNSPSSVYSCSYDGTLRMLDLNKTCFNEICCTNEDDDIRFYSMGFRSESSIIAAQGDGCVSFIDTRSTRAYSPHQIEDYKSRIKSISVHPTCPDYFITSSIKGLVSLWDARKMVKAKSVFTIPLSKSVDSAQFSPLTGEYLLTTCIDNTIGLYDTSTLTSCKESNIIRHNNRTGRWLTNFKASWHPRHENLFVVGSMDRPRCIEFFEISNKEKVKILPPFQLTDPLLNSVCSLNCFHPSLNLVVGANSSGRIHLFYS